MVRFAFSALAVAAVATLSAALPVSDAASNPAQLAFSLPSSASGALSASAVAASLIDTLDLSDKLTALPNCQRKKLEEWVASLPEKRLVKLGEDDEAMEITEGMKSLLTLAGKRFIDVTDDDERLTVAVKEHKGFPTKLSYEKKDLQSLFDRISLAEAEKFLRSFSAFRTRHYRSDTGKQSQQFLLGQIKQIAASNKDIKVRISEFAHPWGQNSIIVRFEPKAPAHSNGTEESVLIVGAHQDSTNLLPFLAAPGADDDGSGTTSLLAAFSSLVNASYVPSLRPVELQWASAEEGGLLGSKAIAQEYAARGIKVHAMLQIDMTAFVKTGTKPTVGLVRDFVDPDFVDFIAKVVEEYADIGYTDTKCGYACSDHASWSAIGAPSAFTIESTFEDSSKNIHSTRDVIDSEGFSFEHVKEFAKVAVGLIVELGGGANLIK